MWIGDYRYDYRGKLIKRIFYNKIMDENGFIIQFYSGNNDVCCG